jgi:iron complex outermembrane receptor protein
LQLEGQVSLSDIDTVRIGEVIISIRKNNDERAGYKKATIDSASIRQFSLGTVAEVLSDNSSLSVKTYGIGGSVTPSFRGTGASNTRISWNGIPIDHPMLGQSDLSIIPAGMTDNINIYYGGASMALNNGGTGAIISLESVPIWKKRTHLVLNPGAGSFGKYSGLIGATTGNENFQSTTRAFFQTAENNFKFLNKYTGSEAFTETRKNSQMKQSAFMQELYFLTSGNILSARIWYTSADRNLPSSMLTQQSPGEHQSDESFRALINYSSDKSEFRYALSGAWVMNRLDYTNTTASIDSRNLANQVTLKAVLKKTINILDLNLSFNDVLSYVNTNNYEVDKKRNTSDIMISATIADAGRLSGSVLMREILDRNKFLLPDFSAGIQYRLFEARELFLTANFSRDSRIPTLNDLYWNPGGNQELRNEYSYILETGYKMKVEISSSFKVVHELTFFRNSIRDMIQWHPGDYSWWTAENIGNAMSSGMETSLQLSYKSGRTETSLNAAYSYTRAEYGQNEVYKHEQLIYIPVNQGSASMRFRYGRLYSSWRSGFTGMRYTTADNTRFLPGYILNNVSCGFLHKAGNIKLDLNLEIDNLFSVDYQTIAYYPMPGRSFFVKLLFESDK